MPADSLVDMSLRACSKISRGIRDIGGMPYSLARSFLLKIENPEQLRALEVNCEQIIGHDAEIWLALIKRDIPNWQTKKHEPRDPKNWWKVYRKLKQESLLEMDAGADKLKTALNDKNEKQLAEIKSARALPRSQGPSLQQRVTYGYQSGKTGSKGGSKMSLLEKIRKEARDARHARNMAEEQQRKIVATAVTRAPPQFVEDMRALQQRAQKSPERPIRIPRSPTAGGRRPGPSRSSKGPLIPPSRLPVTHQQIQEREARLRALTSGLPLPSGNLVATSPKKDSPRKDTPTMSIERSSTPPAQPEPLSASFLDEPSPPSARKILGDMSRRPGTSNGTRSASPHITPMIRKRKKEPDLFMAPAKKKAAAVGGNPSLR